MKHDRAETAVFFTRLKELVRAFHNDVGKNNAYRIPVAFFAVLAYGFSTFNRTVGIDDLARDIYNGSGKGMIAATRWGMDLWIRLFANTKYSMPFVEKFLGVIFLIAAAFLICVILYELSGRNGAVAPYTVFSSLMVTYPLINEIWEYNGANMIIGISVTLVAAAVLVQLEQEGFSWKNIFFAGFIMSPVMAGYESCVLAYITLVLIVIYLKFCVHGSQENRWQWIKEGIRYALPLIVALALRIIIGIILIKLCGVKYQKNGSTGIYWKPEILKNQIYDTFFNLLFAYVQRGVFYMPIGELVAGAAVFAVYSVCIAVKQKKCLPVILGILIGISLFTQGIIQGISMPYRTAQTMQIFVPFAGYLLAGIGGKRLRAVITVLLMFLGLRQGIYLNRMLALNNLRSDNELAVVRNLGYELYSGYDCDKTVVFAGYLELGDFVEDQVSGDRDRAIAGLLLKIGLMDEDVYDRFVDTNVNSVLSWGTRAFFSQKQIASVFSYCGYDINVLDEFNEQLRLQYMAVVEENEMKPLEIKDMGDYILVYLGNGRPGI